MTVSQRSRGGQRLGGDLAQPAAAEADLAQGRALAEDGRQAVEGIAGGEQHLEPGQAAEVVGQTRQPVAGEIEHFERIGQAEDLVGQLRQAEVGQAQLAGARQPAGAQRREIVGHRRRSTAPP